MIIFIAFVLLLFSLFIYFISRDILSPAFISPAIWGILLLLYGILDHGMYELSDRILYVLLVWNIMLSLGAITFSRINLWRGERGRHLIYINSNIRKVLLILLFVCTPYLLYIAYLQGIAGGGDFLFNLRMANTGLVESEYNYGILEYIMPLSYILLIVELLLYKKGDSKVLIFLLVLINITFCIVTMAKSSIFFRFGGCLFVLMFKRKISIMKILIGIVILIVLMSSFQLLRTTSDKETDDVLSNMFYTYIFGGLPALDVILEEDVQSVNAGQYTAAFLTNVAVKTGLCQPSELDWNHDIFDENNYVYIPTPTNVYTVVAPFYMDFSYIGIFCFSFITGTIAAIFYRLARKNLLVGIILYSYMVCVLVMQFFSEYIFANISYLIQLIFWSILLTKNWKLKNSN